MLDPSYPWKTFNVGGATAQAVCGISMDTADAGAETRIWREIGIDLSMSKCDMFAIFDSVQWAAVRHAVQVGEVAAFGGSIYTIVSIGGVFDADGLLILVRVTGASAS